MNAPGAGGVHDTSSGRAVIGRAWRIQSTPAPSRAHSMSCGIPRAPAIRRDSLAISSACRASMADSGCRRAMASRPRTTHSSPAAAPETSRSPRPRTAVTMLDDRSPVIGSAVRTTPAAAGATMRWMITAMRSLAVRSYCVTRAARALARQRSTAVPTSSVATSSAVSNMPANDRSTPSSEIPLDRTANGPLPRSDVPSAPSHDPSDDNADAVSAVTTTPSGTRTPAAINSPRLAALPPTSAESDDRTSRRRRITAALTSVRPFVPAR